MSKGVIQVFRPTAVALVVLIEKGLLFSHFHKHFSFCTLITTYHTLGSFKSQGFLLVHLSKVVSKPVAPYKIEKQMQNVCKISIGPLDSGATLMGRLVPHHIFCPSEEETQGIMGQGCHTGLVYFLLLTVIQVSSLGVVTSSYLASTTCLSTPCSFSRRTTLLSSTVATV